MTLTMIQALRPFLIAAGTLLASAACADPVTYSGTLGKAKIVVEFTADPAERGSTPSARYFYVKHGIDIPLHGKPRKDGALQFDEETACGADRCADRQLPAMAATWRLNVVDSGKSLEGTWEGGKTHRLKLSRIASRPQPEDSPKTPYGLYAFSDGTFHLNNTHITMENSPYDYLRLDVPLVESEPAGWPDAIYRYVHDPRTKFLMPRIVKLGGAAPIETANHILRRRHWLASRDALSCAALRYRGFTDSDGSIPWEGGSLGGFDESSSEVLFLSPGLMSWSESGSLWCGGAHPHNYRDQFVMEVVSGRLLALDDMFTDVADGRPGSSLAAFVRKTRGEPGDPIQAEYEKECGTDELIQTNLSAYLRRDSDATRLVFTLVGLSHAMGACADDVLEVPVAQASEHLRPEFAALLNK